MVGAEGTKILITLDRWKRNFREKNYIGNYFYLPKSTKSTETTSQKCWTNIIWADFFGCPYRRNGIKTHLGSQVIMLKKSRLSQKMVFLYKNVYEKMKNNSFTCVFQWFQYLTDFMLHVENHIKRLTNMTCCMVWYHLQNLKMWKTPMEECYF